MVIFVIVATGLAGMLASGVTAHGNCARATLAKQKALAQIEYIRRKPYDEVGIVGGNPAGTVTVAESNKQISLNSGRRRQQHRDDGDADPVRQRPDPDELRDGSELQEGHGHGDAQPGREAADAQRDVHRAVDARAVRRHQQRDHQRDVVDYALATPIAGRDRHPRRGPERTPE